MLTLAWLFLRIGVVAFGGLGATLAIIEDRLVRRSDRLDRGTIRDALAYTKLLPGSTVVQIVAFLGARMGGWTTAAVCTAAFLLPSMLLMLLLAHGYGQVAGLPGVAAVRRGVLAAVVGLLILTMARLGLPILIGPLPVGLALAAFAVAAFGQANGVWIVLAAGVIGALLRRR